MKKLLHVLTGLCLAAAMFSGCEEKPLDETGGGSGGSGGGTTAQRGAVEGVVTAKETGKPILLASVQLLPTDKITLTDTAGTFKFSDIEPGTYKLAVKRNGYADYTGEEIKVEAGKTVRYNVALETAQSDLQILDTNGVGISVLSVGFSSHGVFVLKNAGEAIVEWEIPKLAVDWISGFSKQSGKLAPGAADTVKITIDRSKLSDGPNEAIMYIGSSVGDKKLLIKAGVERSFCFTDESGEEIIELDMSSVDQYRFKIKNTGSDVLEWKLEQIDASWLTFVGKSDGKLAVGDSETRTLRVDRTRLEEGTYETTLVFSTNAGEKSLPVKVKIEMAFQLVNEGGIEIGELEFGSASSQRFKIKNTGNGVLTWEVSSAESEWLTLGDKRSGSLQPGTTETISMTIDRTKLSVGDNRTTVNISTNAGDKELQVNAHVTLSFRVENDGGMEISNLDFGSTSSQRFKIKNTGNGILTWSVSSAGAAWLVLDDRRSGSLQPNETETIVVYVERMRLSAGDNQTSVNISTNAGDKQLQVNARLDMSYQLVDAQGEEINLLDLGRMPNGQFEIKNTGDGILEWEVSQGDAAWLSLSGETKGSVWADGAATIGLTIDKSKLEKGNNETVLSIHTNIVGGDKQLRVKAYRLQLSDGIPEMVYVAGGTFEMGSDEAAECGPVYNVSLYGFYIGKYEVTQLQWEAVMGTTLSEHMSKCDDCTTIVGEGDTYPMYYVNWEDAVAFCEKLSELTGETYRLPTEAEWEYAARGGQHKTNTRYAGSDNLGLVAWYRDNSGGSTHPVGQKMSNELGLYDMSGNVCEWCSDWFWLLGDFIYDGDPVLNPQGPPSGERRNVRGGCWYHGTIHWTHHVSYRWTLEPQSRNNYLGFRVVREP